MATAHTTDVPGVVVGIHSCGDFLGFHPRLRVLTSWGAFMPEGLFQPGKEMPGKDTPEKRFRDKVARMFHDREPIARDLADHLLGGRHSGFGGYTSEKGSSRESVGESVS